MTVHRLKRSKPIRATVEINEVNVQGSNPPLNLAQHAFGPSQQGRECRIIELAKFSATDQWA
jgi:hypothetical protein